MHSRDHRDTFAKIKLWALILNCIISISVLLDERNNYKLCFKYCGKKVLKKKLNMKVSNFAMIMQGINF